MKLDWNDFRWVWILSTCSRCLGIKVKISLALKLSIQLSFVFALELLARLVSKFYDTFIWFHKLLKLYVAMFEGLGQNIDVL